jgi:Glycine zipper 2TM domain
MFSFGSKPNRQTMVIGYPARCTGDPAMKRTLTLSLAAALAIPAVAFATPADAADYGYSAASYYDDDDDDDDRWDRRDWRSDRRYDRRYDRRSDRRDYRRGRCDKGTGGTIIGAVAGGLAGRELAGRRGDRTTGAIIGGALGALAGRAIDKSNDGCRR